MKFVKCFLLVLSAVLIMAVFSSCNDKTVSDKPVISVSIVPQKAFVSAVCGDYCEVIAMIPPGASPENYTPKPMEIIKFADSVIFFSIGVQTEENNIIPKLSKDTKVIHLEKEVAKVYPDLTLGDSRDPHIWLSPKRVIVMVRLIEEQLSLKFPEQKDNFKKNADKYIEDINQVDIEIRAVLETMENKNIIVFHPAFGYLADEYGLIMHSLEEEGKDSAPQNLQKMIDFAKENNIKVIFYQEETDASQSKAFAEEIGGITACLTPLSEDYIENLRVMAQTIASVSKK